MQVTAVRRRVVAQLRNVAEELAQAVADGLGMTELPEPLPRMLQETAPPEIEESPSLSLLSRPGEVGIRTRRVALLVADGVDGTAALEMHQALSGQGAVPRFVGVVMGQVESVNGEGIEVEVSLEAAPSVLWDACVILDGEAASSTLASSGQALEFLKDQYRHCKTILALGTGASVLEAAGLARELPDGSSDPGLLVHEAGSHASAIPEFVEALTRHRHFERESDPPLI
ncbi:MAG: DJ-1/PfpI family protein [Sinobacteraceae bacterium]|nr:DJ-1/PfpI family protein [Nevskiaceae bacterium]